MQPASASECRSAANGTVPPIHGATVALTGTGRLHAICPLAPCTVPTPEPRCREGPWHRNPGALGVTGTGTAVP